MCRSISTAALLGTLMLAGCVAYGSQSLSGNDARSVEYGNLSALEQSAYDSCSKEVSRFGPVSIDNVSLLRSDKVRVLGRVDTSDASRDRFICMFRSDGRISSLQMG